MSDFCQFSRGLFMLSFWLQTLNSYSQSDIAYRFELLSGIRHCLEYRKPVGEKFKITGSFYFAPRTGNNYYSDNRSIYSVSDSMIVMTRRGYRENFAELRLGGQRSFRNNMFSVKAEMQIGYTNSHEIQALQCHELDPLGYWTWTWPPDCPGNSRLETHYATIGGTLALCVDIPIFKHFMLNFQWSNTMRGLFSPTSIVLTDDLEIYPDSPLPPRVRFDLDSGLGIGLRYRLGKLSKSE